MELTGVVLKQPKLCFSSSSCNSPSSSKQIQFCSASVVVMKRKRAIAVPGFYDQGNLHYYYGNRSSSSSAIVRSEKEEKVLKKTKKKKKRMKLLNGLLRDLSGLTEMNFGLKSDGSLLDQVKGNIIADATERLLEQLQKLRAEEKELKRKKKEEKARLKAVQMQNRLIHYEISSSESSSDTDNEEAVDMNSLECAQVNNNATQPITDEAISQPTSALIAETITEETDVKLMSSIKLGNACDLSQNTLDKTSCSKKIEVCMGGKCKKSGATALLERFQSVVGIEGAVSGCKCMGKCKTGPNVRVLNGFGDESVRSPSNPLCTGVCMEDVDFIVANFLGENRTQLGFAT